MPSMAEAATETLEVEVAYGRPERQALVSVSLPAGSTLLDAIEASGILRQFPEIDLRVNKVGVWGRLASLDTPLRPGDRVEIYRPLLADPKEVRRLRAARKKPGKGA